MLRSLFAALLLAGAEHQIRPHLRQTLGHLASQPHGATRNNGNAAGQIEKLFDIHCSKTASRVNSLTQK